MHDFNYDLAFSRNFGLLSPSEQNRLRDARVAIAGMGGVGGDYVASFARQGIGKFRLADFDRFEIANFNRQYGATVSTIGQPKAAVMAEALTDINPDAEVETFSDGLTEENLQSFISGADLVIDGVDLFAPDWHQRLISATQLAGVPLFAAVPVGFGAGMVGFDQRSMAFNDYFDWREAWPAERKVLQLALGFAPAGYHVGYIDPAAVDLRAHRGPSSVAGCKACAAVVTAQGIAAILDPEGVDMAPWYTHVDFKAMKFAHKRLAGGMRNPLMRLKSGIAVRRLLRSR